MYNKEKERWVEDFETNRSYKINCFECNCFCVLYQSNETTFKNTVKKTPEWYKEARNHSVVSRHQVSHGKYGTTSIGQNLRVYTKKRHITKRETAEIFFIKKNRSAINFQKGMESLTTIRWRSY